jgi:hypothetical protein
MPAPRSTLKLTGGGYRQRAFGGDEQRKRSHE